VTAKQRRELKLAVLERDGYRCCDCGRTTGEVHHIISRGRKHAWRIENMITLCPMCHREGPGHTGAHTHEARKRHLTYLRKKYGYKYTRALWLQALEEIGGAVCESR